MAALKIKVSPTLLESIIQDYFVGKPIHLGLITTGNQISETLIETSQTAFTSIEYNSGSWVRPFLTIPSTGTFNGGLDRWELPSTLEWSIVGPPGGLSISQAVIIIGGSTTPRDNSGIVLGVVTYPTPLTVAAGITQTIEAPWTIS